MYVYTHTNTNYNFFIHLLINGHLSGFHIWDIANNIVNSRKVKISPQHVDFIRTILKFTAVLKPLSAVDHCN
jgi:hypothetical protein